MATLVLEAPKLYLDTCHLINIAKVRSGNRSVPENRRDAYSQLDDLIRNRHFGLIFNPAAPLEWVDGNATLESALEIAEVIDSATLQYELEMDQFVYLREVLDELKRLDASLILPEFEVLLVRTPGAEVPRALEVLINRVPDYFDDGDFPEGVSPLPERISFGTAREHVEHAWEFKKKRPHVHKERADGYNAALIQDRDTFESRKSMSIQESDVADWINRYLRVDRIVNALNDNADIDELVRNVDIFRCPAVNLFLRAREKRIKAGYLPKDNDVDDWLYLPVFPYADVVLTERNLRTFVEQADRTLASRATIDPNQAVEILDKWTTSR